MASEFQYSSPAEALAAICTTLSAIGTEKTSLSEAYGRVLAECIRADRDSPALDVSSVDGFAVRMADVPKMAERAIGLPIAAEEAAIGRPPVKLSPSAAVRIVTGAPIPAGADSVIRIEDTRLESGRVLLTVSPGTLKPGAFIRRRAENTSAGSVVLNAGDVIGAGTSALLASLGAAAVRVRSRVRVSIITTGDELVMPGAQPEPWQLRDSNGPSLAASLGGLRWIDITAPNHAPDDPDALSLAIGEALERSDAVVLTGGVSMGHRDFVPKAVETNGGRILFHRLPQRPGKPMLAAIAPGSPPKPIFGLPGNPVSVLVTARRLMLPALGVIAGIPPASWPVPRRMLVENDGQTIPLWWHRLVLEDPSGDLRLVPGRSSGDVVALARSAGFVEVPPNEGGRGPWPYFGWEAGAT